MGQKERVPAVVRVALMSQGERRRKRSKLDAVIAHIERRIEELRRPRQ